MRKIKGRIAITSNVSNRQNINFVFIRALSSVVISFIENHGSFGISTAESTVSSDRVLTFKAADVHATSPFHTETYVDDPKFSESVRIEASC